MQTCGPKTAEFHLRCVFCVTWQTSQSWVDHRVGIQAKRLPLQLGQLCVWVLPPTAASASMADPSSQPSLAGHWDIVTGLSLPSETGWDRGTVGWTRGVSDRESQLDPRVGYQLSWNFVLIRCKDFSWSGLKRGTGESIWG